MSYVPHENAVIRIHMENVDVAVDGTNWAVVTGTSVAGFARSFVTNGNGRITYVGNSKRVFAGTTSVSFSHSENTVNTWFALGKAGEVNLSSQIQRYISTGADVGALSLSCMDELDHGDYAEVYVKSDEAGTVTIKYLTWIIFNVT